MNSLDKILKKRLDAIRNGTLTREVARQDLIRSGIMTEDGEIVTMVHE